MSAYTALLDASVLYPAVTRDILLQLAVTDLFRAKWTADIHDEWIRSLLRNRPTINPAALQRTRTLMDPSVRDCIVTGYNSLIPSLTLPDPDDRHVLAAALVGRCDVIVTTNLTDFPQAVLAQYGIEAQHPDEFLTNQLNLAPRGLLRSNPQGPRAPQKSAFQRTGVSRSPHEQWPRGDRLRTRSVFYPNLIFLHPEPVHWPHQLRMCGQARCGGCP